MTAVSQATRELVLERDGRTCVSCGRLCAGPLGYSLHHRTPRGMGGTKRPEANAPSNLVTVCGDGVRGCHGWIESNRDQAREWGYLVHRIDDPAEVPVLGRHGWVLFDNVGCFSYCDESRDLTELRDALDVRRGTSTTGDHR